MQVDRTGCLGLLRKKSCKSESVFETVISTQLWHCLLTSLICLPVYKAPYGHAFVVVVFLKMRSE